MKACPLVFSLVKKSLSAYWIRPPWLHLISCVQFSVTFSPNMWGAIFFLKTIFLLSAQFPCSNCSICPVIYWGKASIFFETFLRGNRCGFQEQKSAPHVPFFIVKPNFPLWLELFGHETNRFQRSGVVHFDVRVCRDNGFSPCFRGPLVFKFSTHPFFLAGFRIPSMSW